ncbi:deoxyuridine 5'-triphosphate nucleotidohydrolase-like protein, partial [Leptotrombidium deliense]
NSQQVLFLDSEYNVPNYKDDAGIDLYCDSDGIIKSFETIRMKTKHKIFLPKGYYATVHPRSSTAMKGIIVHATVIDSRYTGEIFIVVSNIKNEAFKYLQNDRLAQIIISKKIQTKLQVLSSDQFNLLSSDRNENGFGSTGR